MSFVVSYPSHKRRGDQDLMTSPLVSARLNGYPGSYRGRATHPIWPDIYIPQIPIRKEQQQSKECIRAESIPEFDRDLDGIRWSQFYPIRRPKVRLGLDLDSGELSAWLKGS